MALQGFGGVLPVAERILVHDRQWLTGKEFVELLAVAQALPGPNVINMSLMIGDRALGTRGALSALAGMMAVPLVIVISLTVLYQTYASHPAMHGALVGMGAVSVGMIAGTGIRLARTQGHFKAGWVIGGVTFVMIALMRMKLGLVVLLIGIPAFALRYWQLRSRT